MLRCVVRLAFTMALSVWAVASGAAQTGQLFGEITGKVSDTQGGLLPGVTVTLSGPTVMGVQTAVTSESGTYRFPAVPSGTYKLQYELAGFATAIREGIIVAVRTTVTQDLEMAPAALEETIVVTGESPVVDIENTKIGDRLDKETLAAVPTTRSAFGATTMLPGMVMGRQDVGGIGAHTSTGMTAHGAQNYNFNYFGVLADAPQAYGSMYYIDFNSAEEISVDTAAMGADVGGGGGANINVIPKSGSNDFRGSVYFNGTNDGLQSDNIDDRLLAQGITSGSALDKLTDINADVGGPIKRDRLWWYGSFRRYQIYERVLGFPILSESVLQNYTFRADLKLPRNNNVSVFWSPNTKVQPNRGAALNRPPESTWNQSSPKNLENVTWTSVASQSTFLEVSTSMFRMFIPRDNSDEWYAQPPASPAYDIARDVYAGAHNEGEVVQDAYRFQVNGAATHYRDRLWGATHQIKAGFELGRGWGDESFSIYGDTQYRYRNGVPAEIFAYNTPVTQETTIRSVAAFVQDRLTYDRFTLNLGLRYAFYDGWLPEQEGGGGRWFPNQVYPRQDAPFNWSNIAPRLGIIYKLTNDARNVVKASYSRYYEHLYTPFFTIINPNIIRNSGVATYRWFGDGNGNGVVDSGEYDPNPVSVFRPASNSIDPNLKQPRADEMTAGYQRELGRNLGLSVSWVQRWYGKAWSDINIGVPETAYSPVTVPDAGPDNIVGTVDDATLTMYNVIPAFVGRDAFRRQSVPGTSRYKSLEIGLSKRLANRWSVAGSYVWSRHDGVIMGADRDVQDPTNPNFSIPSHREGRASTDQPHAFKVLGSYQGPWGLNVGANFQMLSGLPRDRTARATLAQGSTTLRAEPRGAYRNDALELLSFKLDKSIRLGTDLRISGFAELHNVLNSNAAQSYGTLTQTFASESALQAANLGSTAYFGRVLVILPPRIVKFGLRFEF